MRTRARFLPVVLLVAVVAAACGGDDGGSGASVSTVDPVDNLPEVADSEFVDMTGKSEVMIEAKDNKFEPQFVTVSPGTKVTFEKTLLAIHKSYLHPVSAVMKKVDIHGMAHITGGGLYDNVPRVLPDNVDARFDRSTWKTPAIYEFIEEQGKVDHEEMYRVFNMGIGYVLMVGKKDVDQTLKILKANKQRAIIVGDVVAGSGKSVLIN